MSLIRIAFFLTIALAQIALCDLQRQVESIVAQAQLNKGHAGICIIDTATNEVLVEINSDEGMIPASNQKLLTTGSL